jgi:hypothetical protein
MNNMKKKILMAVVAMMSVVSMQAQSDDFCRHEVAVSYGAASNSDWLSAFEHIAVTIGTAGGAKYENEEYMGPLSLEYFYHTSKMIGVGGIFVYGKSTQDVITAGTKSGELSQAYYTLMPAVKFNWVQSKNFGFYTELGVGATIRSEKYQNESDAVLHFNWQASLLGLEAGIPTVRAFMELGCGEKGIISGGLRYKF